MDSTRGAWGGQGRTWRGLGRRNKGSMRAACARSEHQATSKARDRGPAELLHLLEANFRANGAMSYLVGGPVSRMLVGVSTLAWHRRSRALSNQAAPLLDS